ncbi:dehydrodolichyl diphosphate synthase complex subunit DHDDS-like [Physella acuta]|uniref:dehydrodolichyl diphosphate synthase complex subunit DHDDS-like n=1 Tax=Physella acuta TaxID=109671 RepID=UPI0027DC20F1|nr:dehydrodolichyl diphosphate synthase complex subunit DHDDS-like [Physella acuta]XP_059154574.1 dehydrodolichyl diphosphate synthase complex subunit DHDDS-like [Physella acuta]XP_059154575.1 dehydrodolichyl diphosphate synthase complex subunit DHDDS-like [Physella acuta]XP_059154576.1 dehydrodolichyl diphosphate synthase complex subunit DHDDS-like [Physella acuta]XP_059154577.1 dehydrodolichyl diphosphate synthase complex subunit DHDDS-like [Physella acuta]XP_059154578.1 dehydrodolichyl diph
MSWFPERRQKTWVQRACETIITAGPVPKHVAIIMDGNRRFAVKKSIAKSEGHLKGFDKLAETLEWCLDLGITEVTVYAFSIENFKRSSDEVKYLMELSRQKFARLLQERDLIHNNGVCVRIIGDITLLPRDLQELLAEAVAISAENKRAILNVCFAYTARDDMCMAMRELASGVKEGYILKSDISESLLEKCLYTSHCGNVDLLIRTSGELRLSDFLLWESSFSCLAFVKVLWPEFSIWHMYAAILHYQRNYRKIQIAKQNQLIERERLQRESDFLCVMEESNLNKCPDKSPTYLSTNVPEVKNTQARVQQYASVREKRIESFLAHVYEKRSDYIKSLLPSRPVMLNKPPTQVNC